MEAWPSPNDLSRAFKYGYYRLSNDISLIGKMTKTVEFPDSETGSDFDCLVCTVSQ